MQDLPDVLAKEIEIACQWIVMSIWRFFFKKRTEGAFMDLDDVLTDACGLLDDLGTCKERCSDFNDAKKLLEKACKIQEDRIAKKNNPGDWITIGEMEIRKWSASDYKLILFGIIVFLPMAILYTFIHESGHWIVGTIFGWDIVEFKISFFPFIIESIGGHVMYIVAPGTQDWQLVAMHGAGSLFTLIIAYILFFLFYNFKLNRYVELSLVVYAFVFGLDSIAYMFTDLFFGGNGDWHNSYAISPVFVGIVLVACMVNVVLFVSNFKRISREIDLEDIR